MKANVIKTGALIIASAIIWGAVIIACASQLKGTPYKDGINQILRTGVVTHLLFVWAPMGILYLKSEKKDEQGRCS